MTFLLNHPYEDKIVAKECAKNGVTTAPVSSFYGQSSKNGFVLGFGTFKNQEMINAVKVMKSVFVRLKGNFEP